MIQTSVDEIKQGILEYIQEELLWEEGAKVSEDSNLLKVLDSLGIVTLISHLEERYDVSITNDLLVTENLESADALAKLVRSR